MKEPKDTERELARFGRLLSLVLTRAPLYGAAHPYVIQSLGECFRSVERLLKSISPVVFSSNREQLFIDEAPLDPRLNVNRIVAQFKKAGIESLSFFEGLGKDDLRAFLEVYALPYRYPTAEAMKSALAKRGVTNVKINHVVFRKVSADDEVVSRDMLKGLSSELTDETEQRSKKLFVDMVIEGVLAEEVQQSLTLEGLLKDPTGLSTRMIEADMRSFKEGGAQGRGPGILLLQELQIMGQQVERCLSGEAEVELSELAGAVFEMKRRLIEALEAHKALEVSYNNEKQILDRAHELTDTVLIRLLKEEYASGATSASRLAVILHRLIPERDDITRLLPKIKAALLEEGMPLSEWLDLARELGREREAEGLTGVLRESAQGVGIDGEELIEELKGNPAGAAELICLAAEIRKATGDEKLLTEFLVDYVERLAPRLALDTTPDNAAEGEEHLRELINGLQSSILGRLRERDVNDGLLERLERRLTERMDALLERLKAEWKRSQPGSPREDTSPKSTVLEILEGSVGEEGELGAILRAVRSKVRSGVIDENDFEQISAAIAREKTRKRAQEEKTLQPGMLRARVLKDVIAKEVARARRYGVPFSALCFCLLRAEPNGSSPPPALTPKALVAAVAQRLSRVLREADIIGQGGKNKLLVLLPMTEEAGAKAALQRSLKVLHSEPIEVSGIQVTVSLTGVAVSFDAARTPGAETFIRALSEELRNMVFRVTYLHELRQGEGLSSQDREKTLEESEKRYRTLVENSRDVIYTLSEEGKFTSVSPAFETITGWPAAEWLGKNLQFIIHPDDQPLELEFRALMLSGETPPRHEVRVRSKSGEYLVAESMVTPQFQNGNFTGVLGIARDVTERKRAEQALKESEERYRELVENMNEAVYVLDQRGVITYVSTAIESLLGYRPSETIGRPFSDFVCEEDLPQVSDETAA